MQYKLMFLDSEKAIYCTHLLYVNNLRRFLSVVFSGAAKNSKVQCTRMTFFTQPASLATCLKSIASS